MFDGISECDGLLQVDGTVTANPVAQTTDVNPYTGDQHMLFMAMAFKSVSNLYYTPCDLVDHVML